MHMHMDVTDFGKLCTLFVESFIQVVMVFLEIVDEGNMTMRSSLSSTKHNLCWGKMKGGGIGYRSKKKHASVRYISTQRETHHMSAQT